MWNNKNKHIFSAILFVLLIYSCGSERCVNPVIIDKFNINENLNFEIIKIPPEALSPSNIIISDDKLLLFQIKKDTVFDVFQLPECRYLYSAGIKGQGPNDFDRNVDTKSFLPTPKRFSFFDIGTSTLKEVIISEKNFFIDKTEHFDIENIPVNGFKQINDSIYFYWDISSEENEYALYNKHNNKEIYGKVSYPEWNKNQFL